MSYKSSYLLQAKQVQIECLGSYRITVIAWSGISNENDSVVSNLPNDLFYGQVAVYHATPTTKANAQTLKIEHKVSSLALSTKDIMKVFDSKEGSYFYKVKKHERFFQS